MPRVPIPQRQVEIQPSPQIRFEAPSAQALGAGAATQAAEGVASTARAGSQAINTAADIYLKEKKIADESAAYKADTMASSASREILNKLSTYQGERAPRATEELSVEWDKKIEEITKPLTNDQKFLVERSLNNRKESLLNSIFHHVSKEKDSYDSFIRGEYIKEHKLAAIDNFGSPKDIRDNIDRVKRAVSDLGLKEGWKPDVVEWRQRLEVNDIHAGVISNILDSKNPKKDLLARDYFEKNKEEIPNKKAILDALEKAELKGESSRGAHALILKHGENEVAALEESKSIADEEKRELTQKEIKEYYSLQRHIKDVDQKNKTDAVLSLILDGKDVPQSMLNQLEPTSAIKVSGFVKRIDGLKFDKATYYDLLDLSVNDKEKFLKTKLINFSDKLDRSSMSSLISLQRQLGGSAKGGKEITDEIESRSQVVEGLLRGAGIKTDSKLKGTKDTIAEFRSVLDAEVEKQSRVLNRKLKNSEIKELAKPLLEEGVVKKGWFVDDKKKRFQLKPGEKFIEEQTIGVPAADRALIQQALAKQGKEITEANIQKMYIMGQQRGRK